ncbi:TadE/TadG family type IV pilus assembly protein [Chloroflexota bacterium]
MRSIRRDERGVNLVEMAVVLTLLLLLLAGAADIGRAFHSYIIITNASREGARFASHFPHLYDGIRLQARWEAADSGVILVDGDIIIDSEGGAVPAPGEPIRVTVEYDFPIFLSGMLGANTITIASSTQMIVFGLDS